MADSGAMRARVRQLLRRLLQTLLAALALAFVATVAWLFAVWLLAFAAEPQVRSVQDFNAADIERALAVLKRHDPRWQRPGIVRAVLAEQRDVNLLLAHAAARIPGLQAQAALQHNAAELRMSVDLSRLAPRLGLSWPSLGRPWLNLKAEFAPGSGLPTLTRLRLGSVPMPSWAAQLLARACLHRLAPGLDLALLDDVLRGTQMHNGRLLAFYAWQDDTSARLLQALTPAAEQERLRAYAERLAKWSAAQPPFQPQSLAALLQPLFQLAQARSQAGTDALAETRAALLTASLYANRRGIAAVVPAARLWPRPRWLGITLAGRSDLPLHFIVSASLAAESGSPLADAVGLYKELDDSRGGSGFSFVDLAADRAGTRLGELAKRDPRRLQAALAASASESQLLPDIKDLPESLTQEQFEARYGGVGAPAYARMMAEIEARLDTVPLLR